MRQGYENLTLPVIVDFEGISSNLVYVNDEQLNAVGLVGGADQEALCFFHCKDDPLDIECELVY